MRELSLSAERQRPIRARKGLEQVCSVGTGSGGHTDSRSAR